jgi:hypothetical protein
VCHGLNLNTPTVGLSPSTGNWRDALNHLSPHNKPKSVFRHRQIEERGKFAPKPKKQKNGRPMPRQMSGLKYFFLMCPCQRVIAFNPYQIIDLLIIILLIMARPAPGRWSCGMLR